MRFSHAFFAALEAWRGRGEPVSRRESRPVTDRCGVQHWFVLLRVGDQRRRRASTPTLRFATAA